MQEFGTLVEERGIVLITFKDEVLALAQGKARAEVLRDPTDQEAGIESGRLEHPCEQRGRRRLPVRARDCHRVMAPDEFLFYGSGSRCIAKLLDQHRLEFRVPS